MALLPLQASAALMPGFFMLRFALSTKMNIMTIPAKSGMNNVMTLSSLLISFTAVRFIERFDKDNEKLSSMALYCQKSACNG